MAKRAFRVVLQTERGEERREFDDRVSAGACYAELSSREELQFVQLYEGNRLIEWEVTLSKEAGNRVLADVSASVALADLLQLPVPQRRAFLAAAAEMRRGQA
jgi:hypothetical protein